MIIPKDVTKDQIDRMLWQAVHPFAYEQPELKYLMFPDEGEVEDSVVEGSVPYTVTTRKRLYKFYPAGGKRIVRQLELVLEYERVYDEKLNLYINNEVCSSSAAELIYRKMTSEE
jgi:hypothetical protein